MIEIRKTAEFAQWLDGLADDRAIARIASRVERLARGNPGDWKPVGGGVNEMRVDYGPGYRVYYVQRGASLIILLGGGDKRTQERDVRAAKRLAAMLKD